MLAACCLLSAPFCCCCCLGLLAAVGAEEGLFVSIESSCIPSESRNAVVVESSTKTKLVSLHSRIISLYSRELVVT